MDEIQFKSHAEKIFWELVYITFLTTSVTGDPVVAADHAVAARRTRMTKISPKAKAA